MALTRILTSRLETTCAISIGINSDAGNGFDDNIEINADADNRFIDNIEINANADNGFIDNLGNVELEISDRVFLLLCHRLYFP
ncbi:MAG: hypothetical protein F6K47_17780 [Symploca sp. SIO2E6]|nr:hypothetical protein [Symploca sp. SIO2E6]